MNSFQLDLSRPLPVEVESAAKDASKWKLTVKVAGINPVHPMLMNFPLEHADDIQGGETYYALLREGQPRRDKDGNPKTGDLKTWERWYEVQEWFGKDRPEQAAETGAKNGNGWSDEDLDAIRYADSLRTAGIALGPSLTIDRQSQWPPAEVAARIVKVADLLHDAKADRAAAFAEAHPEPEAPTLAREDPPPAKVAPAGAREPDAVVPADGLLPLRLRIETGAGLVKELAYWGLDAQDADRLLGMPVNDWRRSNPAAQGGPATLAETWTAIAAARNREISAGVNPAGDPAQQEEIQW